MAASAHNSSHPLLLAVTGASGTLYALKFLEVMREVGQEAHLVISDAGAQVAALELGPGAVPEMEELAAEVYDFRDFTARPASGSARWRAMVVLPCTMGTLAAIAGGISSNLIHRAADCFLKEGRPLILAVREAPFNRTHLENMLRCHDAGATIFPAMPSFYHKPAGLHEMARFFAGRIAQFLGFDVEIDRWEGP